MVLYLSAIINDASAQLKDSLPCQPVVILLGANGETDFNYVLPKAKQQFLLEHSNANSQVYEVLNKAVKNFYNDPGIRISSSMYPRKLSLNQFLISPISYYFEFEGLGEGYLLHKYSFLVTIPVIQTARSIRQMGTINLIIDIEDKESINPNEDNIDRDNDYIKKWELLRSYKRSIKIVSAKEINLIKKSAK